MSDDPDGGEVRLAQLRFPFGVVALGPDLRVIFANAEARRALGHGTVRHGARLGHELPTEVRVIVRQLVDVGAPTRPTVIEAGQTRLRVSGVGATAGAPALLFVEDVSAEVKENRIMGEFLRNAAHQLRTPLAGIIAAVDTLQAGAKERPADRDRFLDHVQSHADRLARLARGLLLLARAESGELLTLEVVELEPVLHDIVAGARPWGGVAITARCAPGLTAVGAPDLLRETVAALVDNAARHTRAGTVEVRAEQEGDDVVISISDTGPGIPPELHERIFEPFFRLEHDGEGYGLGLAIAAQSVRVLHGEIDVSSEPGQGTTFTVRLLPATRKP